MWGYIVAGLLIVVFCWAIVEYKIIYDRLSEFDSRMMSKINAMEPERRSMAEQNYKRQDLSFGYIITFLPFAMLNRLGIV